VLVIGFLLGRLVGRLLTVAVVLVIALGAGWYFFIREDNQVQKEAAPITEDIRQAAQNTPAAQSTASGTASGTVTTGAPTTAASTLDGKSYKIIEGQSQAFYLAAEKLSRLPTTSTAKGTTTDVKGEFHFSAGGLDSAKQTTFTVGLKSLKSDEALRDPKAQSALETSKFPNATFVATKLSGMPASFSATDTVMQLTGNLTVHGVTKEVTWELKVKSDGTILSGLGTVKFKYSDFDIKKPDLAGFVTVEDTVTIQIQLYAQPA
jgi:polyisoprenoid-binding protein YceI